MSQTKLGFSPYGQTGAGTYGSTLGKQTTPYIDPVRDRIIELVKSIPFPDKKSVFSIGDYGAADGATSMIFIRDLLLTLKEQHGPEVEFQVIYEDTANNDFNSLFKRIGGIINDPPSYMLELGNVYPLASGINFRKQCVPSNSMEFIMSSAAVHWLSKPIVYKESIFAYPFGTEDERQKLDKQTISDWESFLLLRSRELKSGGVLLTIAGAKEEIGKEEHFTMKTLLYLLTTVWKSFRDSGRITPEEFINTNFCFSPFTLDQLKTPFVDLKSPVCQSGLQLVSAELITVKDVFYCAWKERMEVTGVDDRKGFAQKYVAAHRAWGNSTIFSGLSEQRPKQERDDIVNDFFSTTEEEVSKMNPEVFKNDLLVSYVVMRKDLKSVCKKQFNF